MNWVEVMTNNANASSRDRNAHDERAMGRIERLSWDPHEVWLSRVRQPRELAPSPVNNVQAGWRRFWLR